MVEQPDLSGFTLDDLRELAAHGFGLEALGQRLAAAAVAEIDRRDAASTDGARSSADWVAATAGYEHHHAAEFARVAAALADLPHIADAFGQGRFCFDQVRHLTRYATADTDTKLAESACGLTAAQLRTRARCHDRRARQDAEQARRTRAVRTWVEHGRGPGDTDMWHIDGVVPVDEGAVIEAALADHAGRVRADPDTGEWASRTVRYADALVALASNAAAAAQAHDSHRAVVAVTIPFETYLGSDRPGTVDLPAG